MPPSARSRIGKRIRIAREARGMSQGELSRALGVAQKDISNYERSDRVPRLGRLETIAEILGVDVGYFHATQAPEVSADTRFTGDVLQVALLVQRLTARDPKAAKRILKALRTLFVE